MKIALSKYAGFCDGVKRAYGIVEKASKNKKIKRPIFVLGSLVHNQDVVDKIEKMGIKKISFHGNAPHFFSEAKGKIGTLIIRAHGIGPEFYALAKKNKIDLIDATCPRVAKVQRLAKLFSDNLYQIIIIGDRKHKEIKGISEWSGNKARIIETEKDLEKLKISPDKKIAIISQTTQNEDLVRNISEKIKKKYPGLVEAFDTLCLTTHKRQKEIKDIARKNDVVLVIGSPKSANSTHLWEIARKINKKSYFIEGFGEIKKSWLKKVKKIGVSAGASTPPWIIKDVCSFLENKL
jgi:4-hydroxy-3-methylbut-2-enyl diphosphate reductase